MVNNQFHQCASPDSAFQRLHGGGRALENLRMVGFWLSHLYHLCWSMRLCRLQVNVLIFWCGDFEWVFMPSSSPVLTVLDSQENERDEEWLGKNAEKTIVPPFVPSTGPPISIRYPLKAALWEKKGNGSRGFSSVVPRQSSRVCEHLMKQLSMVHLLVHLHSSWWQIEYGWTTLIDFIASLWHVNILLTCFNILQNQKMYALKFGHLGAPFCRFRSFLPKELCHDVFGALESLWKLIHLTLSPCGNRPVICVFNGKLINEHRGKYMKIYENGM